MRANRTNTKNSIHYCVGSITSCRVNHLFTTVDLDTVAFKTLPGKGLLRNDLAITRVSNKESISTLSIGIHKPY